MNACVPICNPSIIKIEVATMLNPISNKIENVWESWSIRAVIVFSLSLQIFLTICSPLRKRMNNTYIQIFIWLAYLMADSAAIFCVGHIASSQVSSNKIKINTQNHLLAFWAPFLLVHLGGADSITAFSLEDNLLWRRHMLGFITQFLFCAYVFLLTVPGNRLWIPTVLVFVAGIIKYSERIYAMYLATRFNSLYVVNKSANFYLEKASRSEHPSQVDVALRAYLYEDNKIPHIEEYFENIIRYMYIPLFKLRVIEVALNLYYDVFFNKFFNKFSLSYGYLCLFITISCLLTALVLFLFEDKQYKQGFHPFDITVTYTLICGAVALDIIALFMQFFSDRVIAFFPRLADFSFMRSILELKRTRWSKCKKNPYTKFTQLSTFLPFRRWSESISGFNLISYSCYTIRKQSSWLHYFNMFSGGTIFMRLNEVKNPFLLELWDLIFRELRRLLYIISDVRNIDIEFILEDVPGRSLIREEIEVKLIPYMKLKDIAFDKLLIMWHIATHLCYVQELDNEVDKRDFSKLLSDYMMYLLFLQSDMIPQAKTGSSDIKIILDDLQANLKPYFINGDEDEVEACKRFMAKHARREVPDFPLTNSNLCINACMLAKELCRISEASIKWEFISKIWVLLLCLAAHERSFSIHFQHLSKGGELISFVWMMYLELHL